MRIHRGEAFARVMNMAACRRVSGTYFAVLNVVALKLCGFQDFGVGLLNTAALARIIGCSQSSVQHALARLAELEILTLVKVGGEYRQIRIHPTLWSPPAETRRGSPNPFFSPTAQNPAVKSPPPFPPTTPLPSPTTRVTGPPFPPNGNCGIRESVAGPPPTAAAARRVFVSPGLPAGDKTAPATAHGANGLRAAWRRILRRVLVWNDDDDGAKIAPGTARPDVPEGRPASPGSAPGPLEGPPHG